MPNFHYTQLCSTYSIVAVDLSAGLIGGAVQTHQMGVGRIIPTILPGVGAVASQSLSNIGYNSVALAMLKENIAPDDIIRGLTASDDNAHRRQVAVINSQGEAAAFSGEGCIPEFGHHVGEDYSIQANMMTKTTVIEAMKEAFETTTGTLAHRMMAALMAAQAEDGDIRGKQSAALKIVPNDRTVPEWTTTYDLRVDEHQNPVEELKRLVNIRYYQLEDQKGYRLLTQADDLEAALRHWKQVRAAVPNQEELGFWQAVTLADRPAEVQHAAAIFNESMLEHGRRDEWVDLIRRLVTCGLIERDGAGDELIAAIETSADN